jgi:GTP-binding protein EngB required for normal cell division
VLLDAEYYRKSVLSGKSRVGKSQLLAHLDGKRLTRAQAIKAKCYDCNGMGELNVCEIKTCPLFGYSQFAKISGSTENRGVQHIKRAIR